MFPGGPNPTQVQFVPPAKSRNPPLPLVLIHDGGGTTFSYFVLGGLGRDVWAIHNPNFFEGLPWQGGMDEMASKYLDLIAGELSGPIMLGGWSLGGFLSLAVARLVAADPASYPISVAGLLIIDSPYHIARSKITEPISKAEVPGLPPLVQKSFQNCDDMLQHWDLPSWGSVDGGVGAEASRFTVAGETFTIRNGEVLYKPVGSEPHDNNWETMTVKTYKSDAPTELALSGTGAVRQPPAAVLLRCVKHYSSEPETPQDRVQGQAAPPCLIDLFRHEKLLGWEARHPDFIKAVIDVDADHYRLFDRTNAAGIDKVTAQLLKALEVLDALHEEKKRARSL